MEKKLLDVISDVLGIEKTKIFLETKRTDIEKWDSLAHIQLVAEIEDRFGVSIPIEEVAAIKKISDFMKFVEK